MHFFQGNISRKRVTDLQLDEFLQYGPQNEQGKVWQNTRLLLML